MVEWACLSPCLPNVPLQVDVEGSELEVLRGLDSSTWRLVRQVAAEVGWTWACMPCIAASLTVPSGPASILEWVLPNSPPFCFPVDRCTMWATGWQRPAGCWRQRGLRCTPSARTGPSATGCSLHGSCLTAVMNDKVLVRHSRRADIGIDSLCFEHRALLCVLACSLQPWLANTPCSPLLRCSARSGMDATLICNPDLPLQ